MKRFDYLDIAKGIGIILVVWAHIMLVGSSHQIIYAFHMPLFFFISGMLFKKDKYDSFYLFLKQRAERLFVPYVLYSIVSWSFWAGFQYIRHAHVDSYFYPLLQTLIAQGSGEFMVHNSALWFVPCLFAVEMLYYLLSRTNEWLTLTSCFVIAGIGWLLTIYYDADYLFLLPWNLDAAFFALPFYGVANAIKRHVSHEQIMSLVTENRFIVASIVVILYISMNSLSMNFAECSMGSSSYGCPIPIFFIRAFLGCFTLIGLSALICSYAPNSAGYNSIKWCGKNSLDIMCLHIPIKGVTIIIIGKVLQTSIDIQKNLLYSMLALGITIVAMIPIILLINKYIRK